MSDKSEQKKRDQLLELEEEDVDSIPIVELSLGDDEGRRQVGEDSRVYSTVHVFVSHTTGDRSTKTRKSKKGTKKRNHTRIPTPPPPIYAEEEMPENAAISGSENEGANEKDDKHKKGSNKKKMAATTVTYTKKDTHDIFANKDEDESGLHDVDLNTPLGDEERFPQSQTYLTPEQVRENEMARLKAERKEQRAAAKAKSKKSASGEKVKHGNTGVIYRARD